MSEDNLENWYSPAQAVARLEANAGRKIDSSLPRQLAEAGKVKRRQISATMSLYWKPDIDAYIVEPRGQKAARAQRQRGLATKQARKKRTAARKKPDDHQAFELAI